MIFADFTLFDFTQNWPRLKIITLDCAFRLSKCNGIAVSSMRFNPLKELQNWKMNQNINQYMRYVSGKTLPLEKFADIEEISLKN